MLGEYTNRYTDKVMQNFLTYENIWLYIYINKLSTKYFHFHVHRIASLSFWTLALYLFLVFETNLILLPFVSDSEKMATQKCQTAWKIANQKGKETTNYLLPVRRTVFFNNIW